MARYFICQTCGRSFNPSRSDQIFCSSRCRYRYYRNVDLVLNVKKEWFDMIYSGLKAEKYVEIKPYWTKIFENYFGTHYDFSDSTPKLVWNTQPKTIVFRNGSSSTNEIITQCTLGEGYGKEEWGAEKGKQYYVLKIINIL